MIHERQVSITYEPGELWHIREADGRVGFDLSMNGYVTCEISGDRDGYWRLDDAWCFASGPAGEHVALLNDDPLFKLIEAALVRDHNDEICAALAAKADEEEIEAIGYDRHAARRRVREAV